MGELVSYLHHISSRVIIDPVIEIKREKSSNVRVKIGDDVSLFLDMDTVRVMCSGFANVLDE